MISKSSIKQIIIITDGCSNQGESPVAVAAKAREQGIIVNVIGIIQRNFAEKAQREIREIAEAGDGLAEFASLADLSHSMQVLTRRSMQMTVEKAIQRQLSSIVGPAGIMAVPPAARSEIIELWENICEDVTLKCLILLDISGSMQSKLVQVEKSVHELLLSFEGRRGKQLVAVAAFPGGNETLDLVREFRADTSGIRQCISSLKAGGNTPTGPAINQAIGLFEQECYPVCGEYVI